MTRDRDVEALVPMDDGVLLSTAATGRGRNPVVLCHGRVGRWEYLQPVAEALRPLLASIAGNSAAATARSVSARTRSPATSTISSV
jgi:hypothetical protein